MSRRLQDIFWDVELTPTEQLVAQRLAWHANDEDARCWPGMRSLSQNTGLSERAIQNATKSLEAAGHISREERVGMGMVYTIHPRISRGGSAIPTEPLTQDHKSDVVAPAADSPRMKCTPAADARTPARRAPKPFKNREDTNGGGAGAARDPVERITGQNGRRIDPDWHPSADLPASVAKVVAGWPPGRIDEVLAEFRDFWIAEAGARASKRDWDKTWHNRLRAVIERDRERNERNGKRNGHRDDRRGNPMVAAAARAVAAGGN